MSRKRNTGKKKHGAKGGRSAATAAKKQAGAAVQAAEVKAPAAPVAPQAASVDTAEMLRILNLQKRAYTDLGAPSHLLRQDWLDRAVSILQTNVEQIAQTLCDDFGSRSQFQSVFTDIFSAVDALKYARKNVKRWMKPARRAANFPLNMLGGSARVDYTPLGTVGCISPWNFPFYLTFAPLAGIFAAGNRVMIKPSELTPASANLMKELFEAAYDEDELVVFPGGPEVGQAFSGLPFDHLLYTGGSSVARHIARAAAENLVPLTLELGGKSPVILGESADMEKAAHKVMFGKTLNAGQICLAPDYVMMPQTKVDSFVEAGKSAVGSYYSTLKHNDDYTSIINQRHYDRVMGMIEDARKKGAELVEINPGEEDFSQQPHHKIPPTLVLNPTDDMQVMQEEIFGPVLPVVGYANVNEAIDRVNRGERPLGLYYFGKDSAEEKAVLSQTVSGGVTVNDVMFHIAQNQLPFGGVGNSGQGRYQGHDGFLNFSHQRAVYRQSPVDLAAMLRPPHTDKQMQMVRKQIGG